MDESTFKLLTSFIVKGRKLTGPIDSVRLLSDHGYARELFRKVEDEGDEELVLISLKLRELLEPPPSSADADDSTSKDTPGKTGGKYKFGARS
jgi:hypothetical protein